MFLDVGEFYKLPIHAKPEGLDFELRTLSDLISIFGLSDDVGMHSIKTAYQKGGLGAVHAIIASIDRP